MGNAFSQLIMGHWNKDNPHQFSWEKHVCLQWSVLPLLHKPHFSVGFGQCMLSPKKLWQARRKTRGGKKKKKSHSQRVKGKEKKNLFWNALCLRLMHRQNLINLKQQSLPWAVSVNTPSSSNRRDNEKSEGIAHPIALLVGSQPVMLSLLHVCIPHQKLIPTSVFTWKYLNWVAIILCPVQQGGFVNISHDKSHSPNFPLDIFEEDRIPPNGLPYQLWTSLLIATEDGRQSCIFTAEAHLSEDAQDQAICSFS